MSNKRFMNTSPLITFDSPDLIDFKPKPKPMPDDFKYIPSHPPNGVPLTPKIAGEMLGRQWRNRILDKFYAIGDAKRGIKQAIDKSTNYIGNKLGQGILLGKNAWSWTKGAVSSGAKQLGTAGSNAWSWTKRKLNDTGSAINEIANNAINEHGDKLSPAIKALGTAANAYLTAKGVHPLIGGAVNAASLGAGNYVDNRYQKYQTEKHEKELREQNELLKQIKDTAKANKSGRPRSNSFNGSYGGAYTPIVATSGSVRRKLVLTPFKPISINTPESTKPKKEKKTKKLKMTRKNMKKYSTKKK